MCQLLLVFQVALCMTLISAGWKIHTACNQLSAQNKILQSDVTQTKQDLQQTTQNYKMLCQEKDEDISILYNQIEALKSSKAKYVGSFKITYYCACVQCCGKANGITASGAKATEGVTIAADTSILPFGTQVYIAGIGNRTVQDRGGAIKGNTIDVYVPSHENFPSVGVHYADVWVVMT